MQDFISAYQILTKENKSPRIYHSWAALSTLASLASRRMWLPAGLDIITTNLYILLVGPAGNGKNTALSPSRKILRNFPTECPISPENQTYQSLIQDLGDDSSGHNKVFTYQDEQVKYSTTTIYATELQTLISTDPIGWVGFLTHIYDEDSYRYKIKNAPNKAKKTDVILNPCVNLLGCMTPDTTEARIKEGLISTGFARRCIMIYGKHGQGVAIRKGSVEQNEALDYCIKWAAEIAAMTGPFTWQEGSENFFTNWYDRNQQLKQTVTESFLASWLDCKDQIVLKVAMALELGKTQQRLITTESLSSAISLVDSTEASFPLIFSGRGRNPIATIATKIRAAVEQLTRPISRKQLVNQMIEHGNLSELYEAISYLTDNDELIQYDDAHGVTMLGTKQTVDNLNQDTTQDTTQDAKQDDTNDIIKFTS